MIAFTTQEPDPFGMPLEDMILPTTQPPEARGAAVMAPDGGFLGYYGLRENPFADAVNPRFFFKTAGHADALQRMLLAAEYNISLGMITGPSGTGKTLVTQLLLQHLDAAKYLPILVLVSPGLGKTGLLREILSELSVALPAGVSRVQELLQLLSNQMMDLQAEGRRLVILIDECHLLHADCLHVLRTITNLETPECKLATCLLFGEARFADRLAHPSYESLRNRMYMRGTLGPMTAEDCAQCVKFRLMAAGRMTDLFNEEAQAALHARSGGIARTLSKLGMLSLIEGAMLRQPIIGAEIVTAAAERM